MCPWWSDPSVLYSNGRYLKQARLGSSKLRMGSKTVAECHGDIRTVATSKQHVYVLNDTQ